MQLSLLLRIEFLLIITKFPFKFILTISLIIININWYDLDKY